MVSSHDLHTERPQVQTGRDEQLGFGMLPCKHLGRSLPRTSMEINEVNPGTTKGNGTITVDPKAGQRQVEPVRGGGPCA